MSLRDSYRNWLKGKVSAGVEIEILSAGKFSLHYVLLKRNKSKVSVVSSGKELVSITQLNSFIGKDVPVSVILTGKGIIRKEIPAGDLKSEKDLLQRVLPNANPGDFYLEHFKGYSGQQFVSLVRKQAAEEVLAQLKANGLQITNCFFSYNSGIRSLPLLNIDDSISNEITLRKNMLTVIGGKIENIDSTGSNEEITYPIGSDTISSVLLLPFTLALSHFGSSEVSAVDAINHSHSEFIEKKKFAFTSGAFVIGMLTLLLFNFFAFQHYSAAYSDLQAQVTMNEGILQRFDTLKKQVELKKQFLESKGMLQSSRTSWYSDQLCASLRDGIRLDRMNIDPLEKKDSNNEGELSFRKNSIELSGTCKKSSDLNEWMKLLRTKTWIKNVSLVLFTQDKASEEGVFTLEVIIA